MSRARPTIRRALVALLVASTFAAGQTAVAVDPVTDVERLIGVDTERLLGIDAETPTVDASLSPDDERFVKTWTARFRGPGLLQAYLDSDEEYDDGYAGLPAEEKRRLVDLLVAYWQTLPGAAEQLAAAKEDPDQMDVDDLRAVVYQVIFEKRALKAGFRADDQREQGPVAATPPSVPADAAPTVLTAEQQAQRLADRIAAVTAILDRVAPVAPPADTYEPVRVATPPVGPEAEAAVVETVEQLAADTAVSTALLDGLVDAMPRITVAVPDGISTARRSGLLDDLGVTYTPCFQRSGAAESCGLPLPVSIYDTTLVPLQAGIPATYDANGDTLPDVKLEVAVNLLAAPGSATVKVQVSRLTVHGNVRATARYRVPSKDSVVTVGFDGRTHGLQSSQQAEVEVADILTGPASADFTARVTHSGTLPTIALVAGFASASSPAALGIGTVTTVTRTPSWMSVRIAGQRASGQTTQVVQLRHPATSALPDVSVAATATLGSAAVLATAGFQALPGVLDVTTVVADAGSRSVTYHASSPVLAPSVAVQVIPNVAVPGTYYTAAAQLKSMPTDVRIWTERVPNQPVVAAAPGGTLLPYGTAGRSLTVDDPDPRTAIRYEANAPIAPSTGNALDASFGAYVGGQPKLLVSAGLSNVPAQWRAILPSKSTRTVTFDSGTAPVARLSAAVTFDGGAFAQAAVEGFPGRIDLQLPRAGSKRFVWNASGPVTKVTADAVVGAYEGHVVITGVPATWSLTLPTSGRATFTAPAGIGSFFAWISTTGGYVGGGSAPNFATFTSDRLAAPRTVRGETISEDVTGAVRFAGVRVVSFEPTATGAKFRFAAGATGGFLGVLRLTDPGAQTRTSARVSLSTFPGDITGEVGGRTEISTNTNTDLDAEVETGHTAAIAATPTPPNVHGASYRDGVSGANKAFKARVRLTGLPTYALVENGNVTLLNFRPTIPSLTVDYERDNDPANLVRLLATLNGLPANGDIGMSFTKATTASGGSVLTATVTSSGGSLGTLTASVDTGAVAGTLATSALPSSMTLTVTEASGTQTYGWQASAPIARIDVGFAYRQNGSTNLSVRGGATITDIPPVFSLTTGRDPNGAGALFTYDTGQTSVPAQRLDVDLWADGSLQSPNAAVAANLDFHLRDLGAYASVAKSGSELVLTARHGEIALIEATVSALGAGSQSWNGKFLDSSWIDLEWWANLQVAGGADDFTVRLTRVQSFRLKPAVVSEVSGVFGTFHMSWRAFAMAASASAGVNAVIDWPKWLSSDTYITIVSVWVPYVNAGSMQLHVYTDGWQNLYRRVYDFVVRRYEAYVDIRPAHHSTHNLLRWLGGLNLGGSTPTTQRYLVTPNPFPHLLPGWAVQLVTGVVKYGGGFISAGVRRV